MPSTQAGAKALVIFEQRFVMVLRDNNPAISNPNVWNLPGGGIDAGESPEVALIRELQEEINLAPSVIEPMGITTYADRRGPVYRFAVRISAEEAADVRLLSEGQDLRWFTLEEALREKLSLHLRAYLETCRDDIMTTLQGSTIARDTFCTVDSQA